MSRVTGLVREIVMARLFGAGLIYDAFMLGFRIPNLTRDLFAEGALSSAFVPTFTEYLSQRSKEEAARLANLVATALIIVVGVVCAAGHGLRAGAGAAAGSRVTRSVPGKFELAVTHDAHHVPVPAAGGAGGAGDGRAERVQPVLACRPWLRRSSISARSRFGSSWASGWGRCCTSRASKAWRSAWCWAARCS